MLCGWCCTCACIADDTKAEDDVEERVYHVTIPGTFVQVQAVMYTTHLILLYMYMYMCMHACTWTTLQEMLRKARQQQRNRKSKQHNTTRPKQSFFKEKLAASGGTWTHDHQFSRRCSYLHVPCICTCIENRNLLYNILPQSISTWWTGELKLWWHVCAMICAYVNTCTCTCIYILSITYPAMLFNPHCCPGSIAVPIKFESTFHMHTYGVSNDWIRVIGWYFTPVGVLPSSMARVIPHTLL